MTDQLHRQIMNLPCKDSPVATTEEVFAYREGHRDARHAAAELVAAFAAARDAEVQRLREALQEACDTLAMLIDPQRIKETRVHIAWAQAVACEAKARAALKEQQQ